MYKTNINVWTILRWYIAKEVGSIGKRKLECIYNVTVIILENNRVKFDPPNSSISLSKGLFTRARVGFESGSALSWYGTLENWNFSEIHEFSKIEELQSLIFFNHVCRILLLELLKKIGFPTISGWCSLTAWENYWERVWFFVTTA